MALLSANQENADHYNIQTVLLAAVIYSIWVYSWSEAHMIAYWD